jgi:hypothetical protein
MITNPLHLLQKICVWFEPTREYSQLLAYCSSEYYFYYSYI